MLLTAWGRDRGREEVKEGQVRKDVLKEEGRDSGREGGM